MTYSFVLLKGACNIYAARSKRDRYITRSFNPARQHNNGVFCVCGRFLCTAYALGTTLAAILPASLAAVLVTTLATTLVTTLAASYDIRMVYILRTRKIKRNGICGNIVYDNACFGKRFFVECKVLKIAAKQGFSISC